MGVPNALNTLVISLLALPWTLKPLWSRLLETYKTKKFFVVLMQMAGGLSLGLVALSLHLPAYFRLSVVLFAVLGFCSATHDIATDGIYIAALSSKEQAAYVGWQGSFYNLARVFTMGGLLWLVGVLSDRFARAAPTVGAPSCISHLFLPGRSSSPQPASFFSFSASTTRAYYPPAAKSANPKACAKPS